MVLYRYIGQGVTNANGVASIPYSGIGKGKMEVVASTDRPIIDGSLQSEPYSLLDATWYDDGVTNPKTVTWYNQDSTFTLTPSSDGTLVETSSSSVKKLFADGNGWTASHKWTAPCCVEVTIVSSSGSNNQLYIDANVSPSITFTGECTLKMTWDGSKVTKYVNGVQTGVTNNVTDEKLAIGFNASNGSFTFKDFMIYPI